MSPDYAAMKKLADETIAEVRALARDQRDNIATLERENAALRYAGEKLARVVAAFAVYEKNPPEIVKDDWAYDRLMLFIHNECGKAHAAWREAVKP